MLDEEGIDKRRRLATSSCTNENVIVFKPILVQSLNSTAGAARKLILEYDEYLSSGWWSIEFNLVELLIDSLFSDSLWFILGMQM